MLLLGLALAVVAPACGSDGQGSAASTGGGHAGAGAGAGAGGEAGLLFGAGGASEAGMSAESGDAGAVGQAGAAAGAAGWAAPSLLSELGLYRDLAEDETLADGIVEYQPRFELWSDGALKRRFLRLPPGERIDTSDLDYWTFPAGTQAFKEFWRDGVRLETRVLQKREDGSWYAMAYAWNPAQTDAEAVPSGVSNALGTEHDIPSQVMCGECHDEVPDRLLGVGALQLSHDLGGFALRDLIAEGRLSHPPAQPLQLPGDEVAQAALGYLHANCGNCHNPRSGVHSTVQLDLWLRAESLTCGARCTKDRRLAACTKTPRASLCGRWSTERARSRACGCRKPGRRAARVRRSAARRGRARHGPRPEMSRGESRSACRAESSPGGAVRSAVPWRAQRSPLRANCEPRANHK